MGIKPAERSLRTLVKAIAATDSIKNAKKQWIHKSSALPIPNHPSSTDFDSAAT